MLEPTPTGSGNDPSRDRGSQRRWKENSDGWRDMQRHAQEGKTIEKKNKGVHDGGGGTGNCR